MKVSRADVVKSSAEVKQFLRFVGHFKVVDEALDEIKKIYADAESARGDAEKIKQEADTYAERVRSETDQWAASQTKTCTKAVEGQESTLARLRTEVSAMTQQKATLEEAVMRLTATKQELEKESTAKAAAYQEDIARLERRKESLRQEFDTIMKAKMKDAMVELEKVTG